jgi:hypothetical protein
MALAIVHPPIQARPAKPLSAESLIGDLIQPGHPLFGIIWINPERLSGALFRGKPRPGQKSVRLYRIGIHA